MITANEARDLSASSEEVFNYNIGTINSKIVEAAIDGKYMVTIEVSSLPNPRVVNGTLLYSNLYKRRFRAVRNQDYYGKDVLIISWREDDILEAPEDKSGAIN